MLKERLKTRKLHSKLIEVQLLEYILMILLYVLSYDLAWGFIYDNFVPFFIMDEHLRHIGAALLVIIILSFYKSFNFFEWSYAEAVKKIITSSFLLNAAFVVLLYFSDSVKLPIYYFVYAYATQIVLFLALKAIKDLLGRKTVEKSLNLIITEDFASSSDILRVLKKRYKGRIAVVSNDDENLKTYVINADNIYLAGPLTKKVMSRVVSYCTLQDKKIYIIPGIFEIAVRNSVSDYLGDTPVFAVKSFRLTDTQKFVKRLEDITLSILGIIITAPIFLLVSISIKHEDGGPIFYTQERSGLNGRTFKVIKFRSMVVDAEKQTGAVLAMDNDQRITKVGCIMRSARIDEIPQFLNVLMGSMSLVGPRPERPVFVEEYGRRFPEYYCRLAVKPGITGLAQVKANYTTSAEKKMKFDLMYIINYSFFLDLKILVQTVRVMLKREQAKGYDEKDGVNCLYIPDSDTADLKAGSAIN
jgi:exopolysaccharide biosynthesis polyprenyl glycosylphosphotransferase